MSFLLRKPLRWKTAPWILSIFPTGSRNMKATSEHRSAPADMEERSLMKVVPMTTKIGASAWAIWLTTAERQAVATILHMTKLWRY